MDFFRRKIRGLFQSVPDAPARHEELTSAGNGTPTAVRHAVNEAGSADPIDELSLSASEEPEID